MQDYSDKLPTVYPEKLPSIRQSKERIKRAIEMYEAHFDKDGYPTTPKGYILTERYNNVPYFSVKTIRVLAENNRG
jgi:hypothetical protein